MLTYVKGNLLDAKEDIIVHQVNCMGAMASGVAKQIREKWPLVYTIYNNVVNAATIDKKQKGLLGNVLMIRVSERQWIANIFGQFNYGRSGKRYTDYDALQNGLDHIEESALLHHWSIALPYKIGCGLGGGDWDGVVLPILEDIFAENNLVNAVIYQL